MLNKSYAIECVTQIIFIITVCVCDREREREGGGGGGEGEREERCGGLEISEDLKSWKKICCL